MRICLLVSLMFFFLNTYSQKPLFDQYRSDTIHLAKIYFKKLVSYQTESVTLLVDYGDFKDNLYGFWKNYHKQIKNLEKSTREKNSAAENALRVIDSVYKVLKAQIKTQDTIFLSQVTFDKVALGTWGNFFPDLIESNECSIYDQNHQERFIIVRQMGTRFQGPTDGYGGRAYFFPGEKKSFIVAVDWMPGKNSFDGP